MMTDFWRDALAIASFVITAASLAYAIVQIMQVKKAAEAARDAAIETMRRNTDEFRRYAGGNCIRLLNEAKIHVRHQEWNLASLRVADLADQFLQTLGQDPGLDEHSTQLREWEAVFQRLHNGQLKRVDLGKWNAFLAELHGCITPLHRPFAASFSEPQS